MIVHADDPIGLNGLAAQRLEHAGQGGGGILKANDYAKRGAFAGDCCGSGFHIENSSGKRCSISCQSTLLPVTGWSSTSTGV